MVCCVWIVQMSVVALVSVLSRALDQIQPHFVRTHSQALLKVFTALLDYRVTANEVGVVTYLCMVYMCGFSDQKFKLLLAKPNYEQVLAKKAVLTLYLVERGILISARLHTHFLM